MEEYYAAVFAELSHKSWIIFESLIIKMDILTEDGYTIIIVTDVCATHLLTIDWHSIQSGTLRSAASLVCWIFLLFLSVSIYHQRCQVLK